MAYNKSPFKMSGKSPLMKQLIGKQDMLPEGLQAAIKASPAKKYGHSPAKQAEQEDTNSNSTPKAREMRREIRQAKKASPAKEINKLSARTINQGDKAEAAYAKGNTKKGNKHTARAARMDARNMKKIGKFNEKASPAKQVKVKDLPEKAVETGEKILEGGKKFIKKIGNITLISKARQDCKKAGGKYSKKGGCFMPENKKKEAK
jgi:hypothetical protein